MRRGASDKELEDFMEDQEKKRLHMGERVLPAADDGAYRGIAAIDRGLMSE